MTGETRLKKIRNFGIVAHIDAGKTTFTERILYYAGRTHKMGEVHEGSAVMDWMEEEQERGITISSAATYCQWQGHTFNIIDTPGHVDFTIEVERTLRVLDGAIVIFCAVGGVEPQTQTVWQQIDRYKVPRIAFINKMDRVGADFFGVLQQIRDKLGCIPLPLTIPLGIESNFKGVIDLLTMESVIFNEVDQGFTVIRGSIPPELIQKSLSLHQAILETLADIDDKIMSLYLNDQEISHKELIAAIRRACITFKLVPVFCGSALRNKSIQLVLDAVIRYLPSPLDVFPIVNIQTGIEECSLIGDDAPLAALCFKVQIDKGRKLVYIRVYSGYIKVGDDVYNVSKEKIEKVTRILRIHANKYERLNIAESGQIVGVIGLSNSSTGDTLASKNHPILLEPVQIYKPVISIAIEPRTVGDQDKLTYILAKLADEDPTFRAHLDEDTGQTIVSGMGELHLEVFTRRLEREFGIQVSLGRPQVVYRETVTIETKVEAIFDRDLGGVRQQGQIVIAIGPNPRGYNNSFCIKATNEQIPFELKSVLKAAVDEGLNSGVIYGYPVLDTWVHIVGGNFISGLSTELGFRLACSLALKKALSRATPVLLEPVMRVEIVTPEEFVGEVISNISARGGVIERIDAKSGTNIMCVLVPLAAMFGYSTSLRSVTQGRAFFSMQFFHYDYVKGNHH